MLCHHTNQIECDNCRDRLNRLPDQLIQEPAVTSPPQLSMPWPNPFPAPSAPVVVIPPVQELREIRDLLREILKRLPEPSQ